MARVADNTPDRLPPHSIEAESALLGCVLLGAGEPGRPEKLLDEAVGILRGVEAFYDLRHRMIWQAFLGLRAAGSPIDSITLWIWLRDTGHGDEVGGLAYLGLLPDRAPNVGMVGHYSEIVREKWVLRRLIATCTATVATLYEFEGTVGTALTKLEASIGELQLARRNPNEAPSRVKKPSEFQEAFWNRFFGKEAQEPGLQLPESAFGEFPFKIRPGETTFFLGEKGKGKSTMLSFIRLSLVAQGQKVFVASMETRPEVTLWMMAVQLLGTKHLADDNVGHSRFAEALAWLDKRVIVYDFLGIADWRELLHDLRYAAVHMGATIAEIDSVMRLGIPDDDYAQQGQAAIAFANVSAEHNLHTFIANHLNKSEGTAKQRSRGSAQWIDNSHNVVSVDRNEKKYTKLDEYFQMHRAGQLKDDEYRAKCEPLRKEWDGKFELHNQRWPGSRQNGSRQLWFVPEAFQYFSAADYAPVCWLDEWKPKQRKELI